MKNRTKAGYRSKHTEEDSVEPAGPLALDTIVKKTFAGLAATVALLAGIAVFTAPFVRTGPELISVTLGALAVLMLAGVGLAVLYTHRRKQVTTSVAVIGLGSLVALAAGAGIGYVTWHARSAASKSPAVAGGASAPHSGTPRSAFGFSGQVAWTDDGGGGGSSSTTLYAFTTPHSHIHDGAYPIHETLTLVCQIPNGRAIRVGPAYKGPYPHSTVWYQMDNGAWVPAVYVQVDKPAAVPACS
jgi:hypothetical protein